MVFTVASGDNILEQMVSLSKTQNEYDNSSGFST